MRLTIIARDEEGTPLGNRMFVDIPRSHDMEVCVKHRRELGDALGLTNGAYGWDDLIERAAYIFTRQQQALKALIELRAYTEGHNVGWWMQTAKEAQDRVAELEARDQRITKAEFALIRVANLLGTAPSADEYAGVPHRVEILLRDLATYQERETAGLLGGLIDRLTQERDEWRLAYLALAKKTGEGATVLGNCQRCGHPAHVGLCKNPRCSCADDPIQICD